MGFANLRGKTANLKMAHEFTEDQIDEFKDAFELFDRTGEGVIPYNQCSSLARCFGYNPTDTSVKILLGGGDEENMPTKQEMEEKSISFDDFLPILWAIANSNAPGTYEDFYEGLKVRQFCIKNHKKAMKFNVIFKVFDKDGMGFISSAELR